MVASRGDQTAINSGHILYLINGRPTREVMEGGIASDLLESFPVGILDHVEIILGPGSVLYGSNAYAAVVNLITRKADGNKITLDTQGGPGNAFQATGEASFQRGAFSLVAAEPPSTHSSAFRMPPFPTVAREPIWKRITRA